MHTNIIGLIYIYLLTISISSEIFEKKETWNPWLSLLNKLFLINNTSLFSVLSFRTNVNILSLLLKSSEKKEFDSHFGSLIQKGRYQTLFNRSYIEIGNTWFYLNSYNSLKNKPGYVLYNDLLYKVNHYMIFIVTSYIYFKYFNWYTPNIHKFLRYSTLKEQDDLLKYKKVMEYNHKFFKIILFLLWDLLKCLNLNLNISQIFLFNDEGFYNSIGDIESLNIKKKLWFDHLEYFKILKQNTTSFLYGDINFYAIIWKKIEFFDLDNKFESESLIGLEYKKYMDILNQADFQNIKDCMEEESPIGYYQNHIDVLYEEWKSIKLSDKKIYYYDEFESLDELFIGLFVKFR